MHLLDKDSRANASGLVDLFTVPSTQTSCESSFIDCCYPSNQISSSGPFIFNVPAGPHYMQLSKNCLKFKCRIRKTDNTNIDAADVSVAPVNLLGKTLIKQLKVSINGKPAFDSGELYAYRAFIETELNNSTNVKNEMLATALYATDNNLNPDSDANEGFQSRGKVVVGSATFEVMAPLHCDLFLSDRLLLSNTQLSLEIHRNSDAFVLTSFTGADFKLEILDVEWYVKKIQLAPSIHMAIEATLQKQPAKYPIRRITMTKTHISAGRNSVPTNTIIEGQLPLRVIIGFVDSDAFYGSFGKSPFTFHNNKLSEISIQAGGVTFPRTPIKCDFDHSLFSRAYLQLLDVLNMSHDTNGITPLRFRHSACFFAFDLTPDEVDDNQWELVREGSVSVNCRFDNAINEGLEMLVLAEFSNLAMLDRNRNVYFDYTV